MKRTGQSAQLREYATGLASLCNLIGFLRQELGGELTLNQVAVLCFLMRHEAQRGRIEMRELGYLAGLDRRAVSRIVASLGAGYGGRDGLQLIDLTVGDHDKRTKLLSLSADGVRLSRRVGSMVRSEAFAALERINQLQAEGTADGA